MTNAALDQLDATRGFEVGVGPSLVVVDERIARSITTNMITSASTPTSSTGTVSWPARTSGIGDHPNRHVEDPDAPGEPSRRPWRHMARSAPAR